MSNVVRMRANWEDVELSDDNRRYDSRRRILKAGIVAFNGRHFTMPCAVRDISDTGAKLRIDGSVDVPDTFELHIELDGTWVECEVVWREVNEIGVRFVSPVKQATASRTQIVSGTENKSKPSILRRPIKK